MIKKIMFVLVLLLTLASVSAASVNVNPLEPKTEDDIMCSVEGSNAVYDYYWYEGSDLLVSDESNVGLMLPSSLTKEGASYTCKVFRPSSRYLPETYIGSVTVEVEK